MKKNRLMKVSATLAAVLMTASATVMTEFAVNVNADEIEAVTESAFGESLVLESQDVTAGDVIEVPFKMYTNNQCTFYDILLEYDSRLELVDYDGPNSVHSSESNGRKYVSLVGFNLTPYQDGENTAVLQFKVPADAGLNETFEVGFERVTNFASDYMDFENYTTTNSVITVVKEADPNAKKEETKERNFNETSAYSGLTLALEGKEAMPGEMVQVPLLTYSNNQCVCYDLLVEFDSRLEFEAAEGVKSSSTFEKDGKKYVSLIGYGTKPFKDGEAVAMIDLIVPENADEYDEYEVNISKVTSFSSDVEDYEDYQTVDTTITVIPSSESKDMKLFRELDARGNLNSTVAGCRGDVNLDGKTDIRDAATIARYCSNKNSKALEISEQGKFFGDVDDNGTLNIRDAAKIAIYVARGKTSWN